MWADDAKTVGPHLGCYTADLRMLQCDSLGMMAFLWGSDTDPVLGNVQRYYADVIRTTSRAHGGYTVYCILVLRGGLTYLDMTREPTVDPFKNTFTKVSCWLGGWSLQLQV